MPITFFEDFERSKSIAKTLYDLFRSRTGFFGGYEMPEYILPKNIKEGSKEHALYLTYIISIDYQTDAVKLWSNARTLYRDHPEYFNPDSILDTENNRLAVVLRGLGARYPSNGAKAWRTISSILLGRYDGDPRNVTPTPLSVEQVKNRIKIFPYLRGKKLSNFYIRAMGEKGLFKLTNLFDLDIPVDVQVARFTIYTGCLQLTYGSLSGCIHEDPIQPTIERIWRKAANALGIAPWELDEPIWTIGSKLCGNRRCRICPVEDLCNKNLDAVIKGNKLHWQK